MKAYFIASLACALIICGFAHPSRPAFDDNAQARLIFEAAERNRTKDGYLTAEELADIFHTFDLNTDGQITEEEFLFIWKDRNLGDAKEASSLFHNADTDKDNVLSQVPDFSRVFYYFDRDQDGKVSLSEFIVIWISLSH